MPLEEVEPAAEIVKRFATGAMSLGSISTEAHTTLAVAMNRIGGKSNTGEGGEDPARYRNELQGHPDQDGRHAQRRDRQGRRRGRHPAAGRRLAALEDQAGRLRPLRRHRRVPGVAPTRCRSRWRRAPSPAKAASCPATRSPSTSRELRYSVPGVGLISPPPHHDIYSIEDLAQLIHDLKNANPQASISREAGVRGRRRHRRRRRRQGQGRPRRRSPATTAAPAPRRWSSIKHAGTPWELGLAETQQTLVLNRLRGRIRVQADGQMKTGRDVVIGALLGADEFGFATAPLVVEGCIMMRKCHLNTCPVGVATQDPVLRKKFTGKPEHVVNYFFFVAEEVREIMAQLGVRTFDELIGRADLLDTQQGHRALEGARPRLQPHLPPAADAGRSARATTCETQDHGLEQGARPHADRAVRGRRSSAARRCSSSTCRSATSTAPSARCSRARSRARYGHEGLPDDTIHIQFDGIGGPELRRVPRARHHARPDRRRQRLHRQGPVGRPHRRCGRASSSAATPTENIIIGNTVLYGAIARRGVSSAAWPASASRCATRARTRWSKARRPRLRVHDRRHRGRARQDRAQLRRRHVAAASPTSTTRTASSPSAATRRWSRWSRC